MSTTRAIRIVLLLVLIWTMASVAEAQRGAFGVPRPGMPQPYRPPTPYIPQPGVPRYGIPRYPPSPPQVTVIVKYCTHCGHQVPDSSCDGQVCPYCGVTWGPRTGPGAWQVANRLTSGTMADGPWKDFISWIPLISAGFGAICLAAAAGADLVILPARAKALTSVSTDFNRRADVAGSPPDWHKDFPAGRG